MKICGMLGVWIVVNFFLVSQELYSNQRNLNFRTLPASENLSQPSVLAMVQDSIGFLWIGTKDGLNRFDGYDLINFKYNPNSNNSLSNNEISCLEPDRGKYLWIGTRSGGVNRMEFATGIITRFNNLTYDDLIRDIYLDSQNKLWVGTTEGLFNFRETDGEIYKPENLSKNAVYRRETNEPFIPSKLNISVASIYEYKPGKLLVGAGQGLFEYNIERNEFRSISAETLEVTIFTDIIIDSKGNIWAGSYDGLFKLKPEVEENRFSIIKFGTSQMPERRLPVDWVEQVVEDHNGNIWLGTRGGGLIRIGNEKIEAIYTYSSFGLSGIPDIIINSLLIDRTGILWIGTESKGMGYIDLYGKKFYSVGPKTRYRDGLNDNLITSITGNNSTLWVGTASSGIDVFKIVENKIEKTGNIPRVILSSNLWKSEIISLLCDSENALWIGSTTNSLVRFSENSGFNSYVVNGFVFSLFEDTRGNIWFGTWGQGLGYINKNSRSIVQYNHSPENFIGLSSDKILSIFIDSRDYLWVGTKGGGVCVIHLNHIFNRTGGFHTLKHIPGNANSLTYNDVYSVLEDSKGNIWVATGSGLNKVEIPTGITLEKALVEKRITFKHVTEEDGLSGGIVFSMEEDNNGNLWLGTNKGITRYNPESHKFISYGPNDGLQSSKFLSNGSFNLKNGGLMFFGGIDGLTYFSPDSITANPFPASVQITGLRLHNSPVVPGQKIKGRIILEKSISQTKNLELAFGDNEITFEFSALHFSSPEKNRYKYRLLGFNNEWQETGSQNRRATYTNLRPGDYIFQVTATNNDGIASDVVARLNLTILPPLWRTLWAYGFYILCLMFLLWIFRKYSIIGVKKKNRLVIESLEHKRETEMIEAKMRFFTNVSHEIRTPLTLINAPLQQLLKRETDSDTHQALVIIHRNVKRLLNQVTQLLEFRRMEKGHSDVRCSSFSIHLLINEIIPSFEILRKQKDIDIIINKNGLEFIYADRNLMATVVYNLISNSLKFTPEKGNLTILIDGPDEIISKPSDNYRDFVKIRICDTGPGIPDNELNNVFQRFYQVSDKSKEHLGGSGIGLSIVKEFVEKNEGTITVYNLPEQGCCFEILIPAGFIVEEQYGGENISIDEIVSGNGGLLKDESSINHKQSRILIVEDDVELAAYLKSFFDHGYTTQYIHDGLKAWEMVAEFNPDIIICDVMLPGINGIELCKRIKGNEITGHIPVIMLTAKTEEESMLEGLTSGADSYLIKPFNINVLEAQVSSLIKSIKTFKKRYSQQFVIGPNEETITPMDEKFLKKLIEIIENNIADTSFDVPQLIESMHMSHSIILKKVKVLTGLSLVEFIRSMRIKKAAQIFKQDKLSVSEVGFMVGFSDPKYFSKCFTKEIGKKPTDYIKEVHG